MINILTLGAQDYSIVVKVISLIWYNYIKLV